MKDILCHLYQHFAGETHFITLLLWFSLVYAFCFLHHMFTLLIIHTKLHQYLNTCMLIRCLQACWVLFTLCSTEFGIALHLNFLWLECGYKQPLLLQHEWSLSALHDCSAAALPADIGSMCLSLRGDALLDWEKKSTRCTALAVWQV